VGNLLPNNRCGLSERVKSRSVFTLMTFFFLCFRFWWKER